MQHRIDAVIDNALAQGRITGTAIIVMKDGDVAYERMAGFADREEGRPVRSDTIFRLASVTKPLIAATALALYDQGKLQLDGLVRDILPYFQPKTADGRIADITTRHLLTHTAGFTYDATPTDRYPKDQRVDEGLGHGGLNFETNFTRLAAVPLAYEPGTQWAYSTAIDVLGAVISKIDGTSLDTALAHYVTGPLGMTDTGFFVRDPDRLATPYADAEPEPVHMQDPHTLVSKEGWALTFSPSRIFNPDAYQSGGAGAVGTPRDLIAFLETIRKGGEPVLRQETAAAALVNQIGDIPRRPGDEGQRFSFLGAVVADPRISLARLPKGSVRWGGVYGHSWSIDPANGITVLAMTNNALEGCMGRYPADIVDAVYAN